jgi:PPOX class probable F420-dependent enzyme
MAVRNGDTPGMKEMPADQVFAFLDRSDPPMLGVLGTTARDGAPRVVPLWYRYDGEVVTVWSGEERVWVHHLRRDPRFAFSVQESAPPFGGVIMHGRADVVTSDGDEVSEEIRRITRRYIAEDQVESYVAGWPQLRTIVTLRPDRIKAWGTGY